MRILLADAHKHNRLASRVDHVKRSSHFLVDCVELSQDDSIDGAGVRVLHCVVNQVLVELRELVYGIIAYEGFTHEENHIRVVDAYQSCKSVHLILVALHAPSRVDK